jgi:hypothetical protein
MNEGPHTDNDAAELEENRIGTQEDGSFVITNVPAPVECATKSDKEDVNVGDIQIQPGHTVHGKVTLSDGGSMADGMRVTIVANRGFDIRQS